MGYTLDAFVFRALAHMVQQWYVHLVYSKVQPGLCAGQTFMAMLLVALSCMQCSM